MDLIDFSGQSQLIKDVKNILVQGATFRLIWSQVGQASKILS